MVAQGNIGLAFALVTAAGLATTLGAAIVFCTSLARPRLLAGSLGFAAGVMLYVSFAEIFLRKSVASFEAVQYSSNEAYRWSTLCFFGGMAAIAILDQVVHFLVDLGVRRSKRKAAVSSSASAANLLSQGEQQRDWRRQRGCADLAPAVEIMGKRHQPGAAVSIAAAAGPQAAVPAAAAAAAVDVEAGDALVSSAQQQQHAAADTKFDGSEDGSSGGEGSISTYVPGSCDSVTGAVVAATSPGVINGDVAAALGACEGEPTGAAAAAGAGTSPSRTPPAVVEIMAGDHHHAFMLKKMGILTGLAIFIHNFPEGLATFVGALADAKIGVGLAVAIAMHNVPEGICVAMPIYYATGSRWKGFLWAFLSGVSEPIGGLLGYLVLDGNNDLSFAIVFGLVAGMMVYISVKELIPTALRYDPQDSVATTCVIAGMVVMAGSLLLFTI